MVKIVLDTQQVRELEGIPPGSLVRLDIHAMVEGASSPEDGFTVVTLDVKGCTVQRISDGGDPL
jgi:hypothetical protein